MEELPTEQSRVFSQIWECARRENFTVEDKHFLLALSGGRDSLCVFYFFIWLRTFLNFNWTCIHFQHGLRGLDSERDEQFCVDLCSRFSVPVKVHKLGFEKKSNLQDQARRKRMAILKREAALIGAHCWIVTGHHQNDHLESILIGIHQGRLDDRLKPILMIDHRFQIFRPLAQIKRSQITELLCEGKLPWREDQSNQSSSYLRNYYRKSSILQECGEDLLEISEKLAHMDNGERLYFKNFILESAQFQPEELSQCFKAGVSVMKNRIPVGEIHFNVADFSSFSELKFQAFWFFVLQSVCSSLISDFDSKRLLQVFKARIDKKKIFSLAKSKQGLMEFRLTKQRLTFIWQVKKHKNLLLVNE